MTATTALLQVLLVEDDLADVALLESSFAEHQAATEPHHVVEGAEALAFLRRQGGYADAPRRDLILLDLHMPRVDGRQLLTAIKADEKLQAIPVIVFTTSATPADISPAPAPTPTPTSPSPSTSTSSTRHRSPTPLRQHPPRRAHRRPDQLLPASLSTSLRKRAPHRVDHH